VRFASFVQPLSLPALNGFFDAVEDLIAVVGQLIDLGLQLDDSLLIVAALGPGFLHVQFSQSLAHIP
jgi:hypothetical protein